MTLKYFSCFSGIGAAELAIESVFPNAICVGYSEIDDGALQVYQHRFPKHKNYGDITKINIEKLPRFDLLIGGSPCQGFSSMNKNGRKGFKDKRSSLIHYIFEIIKVKKPPFFILENVASMSGSVKDTISRQLGFAPVAINSKYVSAQHRSRVYWTNFTVPPLEQDIMEQCLKHILDPLKISKNLPETNITIKGVPLHKLFPTGKIPYAFHSLSHFFYEPRQDCKSGPVLTTLSTASVIWDGSKFRQLTPEEMEALQGFPKGWTNVGLTRTQRVKCIGNAFTVPTIIYILQFLKLSILK